MFRRTHAALSLTISTLTLSFALQSQPMAAQNVNAFAAESTSAQPAMAEPAVAVPAVVEAAQKPLAQGPPPVLPRPRSAIASGVAPITAPFSVTFLSRNRVNAVDYYDARPFLSTYPYVDHFLRIAVAEKIGKFDWLAELGETAEFDLPTTAISNIPAQGQLFLGGTYYAANGPNNTTPVAASFRQGWLRYHGKGPDTSLRIGRFEFFDGQETAPGDPTLTWLQNNRIAQRLIGNFAFSNGQRSFDGIDGHYGKGTWDVTAMAGRVTQGVFNMNANPELNVDIQYLAYTRRQFKDHLLVRAFGLDYHDGRTGLTKTDNRAAAVRATDHKNIRIGTYGADAIASIPVGKGTADALFWGVLQNGQWGVQNQHSGAVAVEAGYRFNGVVSRPWIRGGFFRSTGDTNPTDDQHNTFFQVLPTPRIYARFPFYDLQNNRDQFIQLMDSPSKRLELRADLHFLQLTSPTDLLYNGGGAYDKKVFGYTGRTANNHTSLASIADMSADFALTPSLNINGYFARSYGKTVLSSIYLGNKASYGYLELIYKFNVRQKAAQATR